MESPQDVASAPSSRILVVDDDQVIRTLMTEILNDAGYEVITAAGGQEAVGLLERDRFDLIITDLIMPDLNGIEVLRAAIAIDSDYRVIIITGYPSPEAMVQLVRLGATDYIIKPFNIDLINMTIAKALQMKRGRMSVQGLGVYSFGAFAQILDAEVKRSQQRGHICSLLILEIDNLETYPANGRVEVFTRVLGLVREQARPGDVVGWTGSQITLMLPETSPPQAESLGQNIVSAVDVWFDISGGIACFPQDASDWLELMNKVRAIVEAVKARGGGSIKRIQGR